MPETVSIKKICGKKITTRDDGILISEIIEKLWDGRDEIVIDFNNIPIASVSFLDQAIGVFALERDLTEVRAKLRFENMNSFDRRLLEDILTSREMQRSHKNRGGRPAIGAKSARRILKKKKAPRQSKTAGVISHSRRTPGKKKKVSSR